MINQWPILYNLWERTCAPIAKKTEDFTVKETWSKEVYALYELGIGMEETIRFLYIDKPSLDEFKNWLSKFKSTILINDLSGNNSLNEDVLTKDDLMFWKQNGYVVLKNVISEKQCIATQLAIWEFLNMTINDPTSWYKTHEDKRGLMVLFTHHPTLDANRESPIIKKAYEQLYGTTEIYKTIDKVSFNPPETHQFPFLGSKLHWDVSLALPIPFSLQGMLYLTNCSDKEGAFHCVPSFHNQIDNWLINLPIHINPREEALVTLKPKAVTGNAGDFIIWHQALPHCATPNHGATPRMVQYLTYLPKNNKIQKEWR